VDRYQLAREFEFVRQCDEIHRIRDLDEAKKLAITLLRLNRCMRETVAAVTKSEIPERQSLG
jgi:hypothetical protein